MKFLEIVFAVIVAIIVLYILQAVLFGSILFVLKILEKKRQMDYNKEIEEELERRKQLSKESKETKE